MTDAIVLGFAKSALLIEQSFAPLRQLHQEGVIRNIHYVTWDSAELDAHVAPVLNMPEVQVTRVPQPNAQGTTPQKTLVYQIHNLNTALGLIPDRNTVVLKSRPDFVAKAGFLRGKIVNFERDCAIENTRPLGVAMPQPIFRAKIWTPWADSNQPFFYEDAALLGRKADLLKVAMPVTRADLDMLAVPMCDHYYHIIRFAKAFLPAYPLFADYLLNYRYITSNMDYRIKMIGHVLKGAYFLFLLVAHAWILRSHFHVDCGESGDLRFYANNVNKTTDWADPETWNNALPYPNVAAWRQAEMPGWLTKNTGRPFGRLMSDAWQTALFEKVDADIPQKTLRAMLEHISQCCDGRLKELERDFYADLAAFYRNYMQSLHERKLAAARPVRNGLLAAIPAI